MKTLYLIRSGIRVFIAILIIGCGAETVAAILFIPAFSATWNVEGNDVYRIDLQPDEANKGVHAGVFEGEEQHDTIPAHDGNFLSGSFSGLNIEFTIERPNNEKIQYVGRMQTISDTDHQVIRIELQSTEGALVLVQ